MSNHLMLKDKIILVTGARRGIGLAIAKLFISHGAHVLMNARIEGSIDKLCEELTSAYDGQAEPLYFDVSDPDEVKKAFTFIHKNYKKLDVVVNNAGVMHDALIGMVTQKLIDDVTSVNINGVIYCSQYAARLMTRQKSGSIINMSSIIGRVGNEGQAVYSASKAAVLGFTYSLAKELAPQNIRVNAIAPGFINTDMIKAVPAEKRETIIGNIKMERLGEPEDIANVALFLASGLSSYVTGQVIGVDGGMLV